MIKKMSSKKKYRTLQIVGIIVPLANIAFFTFLAVLLSFDKVWETIPTDGITSFYQWVTLILYRLNVYLAPGFVLSTFVFDKRYKWFSRLLIWFAWTFGVLLVLNATIKVFSIEQMPFMKCVTLFNNIDAVVLLTGFAISSINKKKVEFDKVDSLSDIRN